MSRRLPAKWLWTIIVTSVVVAAVVTTVVLLSVFKKDKKTNTDYIKLVASENAVFDYSMGDDIDLSGFVIEEKKDGVVYLHDVTLDMINLPASGVDTQSGLGVYGKFLSDGDKKIKISYGENEFEYGVSVEKDSIVAITFAPSAAFSTYENVRAVDIVDSLEVYAFFESGKIAVLSTSDIVVAGAYSGADISDGNMLVEGRILKTNTSVYSQSFVLVVKYDYRYGENLPTKTGENIFAELDGATIVDSHITTFEVPYNLENKLYRSVVTNTDFIDILPQKGFSNTEDGQTDVIYFSDGRYLFEIVEVEGKKAYAFVLDSFDNLTEYEYRTRRNAYLVSYYINGRDQAQFLPFGDAYLIVGDTKAEKIPSTAQYIGDYDGRAAFLPNEKSIFFGENTTYVNVNVSLGYETRIGEIWILDTDDIRSKTSAAAAEAVASPITALRRAANFFVACGADGDFYVTKESFEAAFANLVHRPVYIDNYGFSDQKIVEKHDDGWYYYEGNVLTSANVTEVEGYFSGDTMVGFVVLMPYEKNLKTTALGAQNFELKDGNEYLLDGYHIDINGFVLKLTQSGTIAISGAQTFDVDPNLPKRLELLEGTGQSGAFYAGNSVNLNGFGFALVLENDDKVVYLPNRTVRYFAIDHDWTDNDSFTAYLVGDPSANTIVGQIISRGTNSWPVLSRTGAVETVVAYIGELNKNNDTQLLTSIIINTNANIISNVSFVANTLIVSSGETKSDDISYALLENVASLSSDTLSNYNRLYAVDKDFAGMNDFLYSRVAYGDSAYWLTYSIDDNGHASFVLSEAFDDQAHAKTFNFTIIEQKNNLYHTGLNLFGFVAAIGEKAEFDGVSRDDVYSLFSSADRFELYDGQLNYINRVTAANFFTRSLYQTVFAVDGIGKGSYMVVGKNATNKAIIAMSFEVEENGVAETWFTLNNFENTISGGAVNKISNATFADGASLDISDFKTQNLHFRTLSGDELNVGVVANLGEYLRVASPSKAPSGATKTIEVVFEYSKNNYSFNFSQNVKFFEYVTQTPEKIYGLAEAFASETGLEAVGDPANNEFAFYRRDVYGQTTYADFADGYIDERTTIESIKDRLLLNVGLPFHDTTSAGYGSYEYDVNIVYDETGHYIEENGVRYYIEEDYVTQFGSNTNKYSRCVVDTLDGRRVVYVAINPNYKNDQPESLTNKKYLGIISGAMYVRFSIFDDEAPESSPRVNRDPSLVNIFESYLGAQYSPSYDYVYLRAYVVLFGTGTNGTNGEIASDIVKIRYYEVPKVTSASSNSDLVEGQALYLTETAAEAAASIASLTGGDDRFSFAFPHINVGYKDIYGNSQNISSRTVLSDVTFLPFVSTGAAGEIGYTISDDGKAILIGSYASSGKVAVRFMLRGMKFEVSFDVHRDTIWNADYDSVSVVDGTNIFDGMLAISARNCVMLSGKKIGTVSSNANGVISGGGFGLYVSASVSNGISKLSAPGEYYKLFLSDANKTVDKLDMANRIYSFQDSNLQSEYRLVVLTDGFVSEFGSAISQFSLFANIINIENMLGDYAASVFGAEKSISSAKIDITTDRVVGVDLSNVRTQYAIDAGEVVHDYFSFEGAEFTFASGLKFTCSSAAKKYYLASTNGDIVCTDSNIPSAANNFVLRRFEIAFGGVSYADGKVVVRAASLGGNSVDLSGLSFVSPTSGTLSISFESGSNVVNKTLSVAWIDGEAYVDVSYTQAGLSYDWAGNYLNQTVTKSTIVGYIDSARVRFLNENLSSLVFELTSTQIAGLFFDNGNNYNVRNGGLAVYINDATFALTDIVWNFDFDYAELFEFVLNTSDNTFTIASYLGDDTDVYVPGSYNGKQISKIGSYAFSGRDIEEVELGSNIVSIGENAFNSCTNLTYVSLPSGLVEIGNRAFAYCENLGNVTFPNGLETIGVGAFYGCSSMTSLVIPASVTSISDDTFSFCSGLESIVVNGNDIYSSGNNCNAILSNNGSNLLLGCKNTQIPSSVISIGYGAFQGCTGLLSITVPNSVNYIDSYAFYGCTGLVSVTIPSSVVTIGTYAFSGCSDLQNVSLLDGIEQINEDTFADCTSLESISIPNSVVRIKERAFAGCTALRTVGLSSLLNRLENEAFAGCTALETIDLPDTLVVLGESVFANCSALTRINVYSLILDDAMYLVDQIVSCADFDESACTLGVRNAVYNDVVAYCNTWNYVFARIVNMDSDAVAEQNYEFELNGNEYAITNYIGNDGYADIPETYMGLPVTTVSGGAFNGDVDWLVLHGDVDFANNAFSGYTPAEIEIDSDDADVVKALIDKLIDCDSFDSSSCTIYVPDDLIAGIESYCNSKGYGFSDIANFSSDAYLNKMFEFESNGNGYTITAYIGRNKDVVIPSVYNGLPVTKIGVWAFGSTVAGVNFINSVFIPNTIEEIEGSAFCRGDSLTSVVFESGSNLRYIGPYAFRFCYVLPRIIIPKTVTEIGEQAFDGCRKLGQLVFENGSVLSTIGAGAFSLCSFVNFAIPSTVTSIGDRAFSYCLNLSQIVIPRSVSSIGRNPFAGCSSLISIVVENGNSTYYSNGANAIMQNNTLISGCKSTVIPSNITTLADNAFWENGVTSLTIPSNVANFGSDVFFGCKNLVSVYFDSNDSGRVALAIDALGYGWSLISEGRCALYVRSAIYDSIVQYCSLNNYGFRIVNYDRNEALSELFEFEEGWFYNSYSIKKYIGNEKYVTIPESYNGKPVVDIGMNAFSETPIINVYIPNSIKYIYAFAFSACSNLKSITIPNSVTNIGEYAFSGCSGLTSVTILDGKNSLAIGEACFGGCTNLKSVYLPSRVNNIGRTPFSVCTSLTSIVVDSANTYYDSRDNCNAIIETSSGTLISGCMNTVIPSGVTEIGEAALAGIVEFRHINIPVGVKIIHSDAFWGCTGLREIVFPDGLLEIHSQVFVDCKIRKITLPSSVTVIGYLHNNSDYTVVNYLGSVNEWIKLSVPPVDPDGGIRGYGVYGIGTRNKVLFNGQAVSVVNASDFAGVTTIGGGCFVGFTSLTSVIIPSGVTEIEGGAFAGCSNLRSVTIPSSVTEIGDGAFSGCSSLTSVTIPGSVTSIGNSAFLGCTNLSSVTINSGVQHIGESAFRACSSLVTVYIPDSVIGVWYYAFYGCSSLESVSLPGSLRGKIKSSVFGNCPYVEITYRD